MLLCVSIFSGSLRAEKPWSCVYQYIFSEEDEENYEGKHHFIYKKNSVMPFTQLIFSWNSNRPEDGSFLFKLRVRDAATKKWDTWHKVATWGVEQKSFFSRGTYSTFHYSRLEMEKGCLADGFEIEVDGEGDATIDLIKGIFIAVSNQSEFVPEPYNDRGRGLRSCKVKRAVKKSQMMIDHPRANALCSPTSVSMMVQTLQKRFVDPLSVAQHVYDPSLNIFGNWAFNMAHAFELGRDNLFFYAMRPSSFDEIHKKLRKNFPVAVSIRGPIKGGYTPYKNGHLLVVVGWDAHHNKVICFDPASHELNGVRIEYDIHDFIPAWERSRRLTYMPELFI